MPQGRGKGGPLGMIIGAVGSGVGLTAEYRAHRKEQKLSRENSRQSDNGEAAGSSASPPQPSSRTTSSQDIGAPPAYNDVVDPTSERTLSSGAPPTHDDKKAALAQYDDDDDDEYVISKEEYDALEKDEADWQLDELQSTESKDENALTEVECADTLVRDVMEKQKLAHLSSPDGQPFVRTPIPFPVIIPQRRPGSKDRGFIHAYAPLLGECSGIDQDTFITFIRNFYKSSQASPAFGIVMLASGIVGFVPEPICQAVSMATQAAAQAGAEVHQRYRTNNFLDKMNEELFKPNGLFCMIVKYKSQEEVDASGNSLFARLGVGSEIVDVNTNQTIAKYDRSKSDGSNAVSRGFAKLRIASGTTKGAIHLPESAPLVFPKLDQAIVKEGPETFKDKAKDAGNFFGTYLDKRAQIKYARDDPTSSLIVPESERTFKSKWADPNHPVFNSGPIGLLSGGKLSRDPNEPSDRHYGRNQRRLDAYERRMESGRHLSRSQQRHYDDYTAQEQARYGYGAGGQGGFGQGGFGGRSGGRRGHGGPIGLAVGLVGSAIIAASNSRSRSRGPEDEITAPQQSNAPAPHAPYGGSQQPAGRRSFEDRQPPYGQQEAYDNVPYDPEAAAYGYGRGGQVLGPNNRGALGSMGGRGGYGGRGGRGGGGGPLSVVGRLMKEDVLYLMIVNMPSEEELARARAQVEAAKNASSQ